MLHTYMMACTMDRDHTDSQPVKIQTVIDPGTYWLIPDQEEPPAKKIDQLLTERIRETKRKDFLPIENQMVAIMDPATNLWHRGKVITIFLAEKNHRYLVFLVDYGTELKVAHNLVCELPTDEVFQKEHHATRFKLYGVVPCNKQLSIQVDFQLESVSGKQWDPIAYRFVADKSAAATAIYISQMKGVDLCDGDVIQGDLHFIIGGRCISMIEDLCSNQYAVYNELLYKKQSGVLTEEKSKPQPAYNQMELENLSAADGGGGGGPIATQPSMSYGRGRMLMSTNPSVKTSVKSSWVLPSKEPALIPAGMNVNALAQKTKRVIASPTKRHENKSPHSTNSPNTTEKHAGSIPSVSPISTSAFNNETENSLKPTQVVGLSESPKTTRTENSLKPTQVGSESPKTTQAENSPKPTQVVINESPKTTNDMSEQLRTVVSPISPDSPHQCVTARGRRFQALLKAREAMKEEGNANESLEDASFDSSLDSFNTSSAACSPSGLFSKIKTAFDRSKTESNDSNCELTPVNSPRSLNNESPSNTSSGNVIKNKFLSLLDDLDDLT